MPRTAVAGAEQYGRRKPCEAEQHFQRSSRALARRILNDGREPIRCRQKWAAAHTRQFADFAPAYFLSPA
jgi:hypothetical protein